MRVWLCVRLVLGRRSVLALWSVLRTVPLPCFVSLVLLCVRFELRFVTVLAAEDAGIPAYTLDGSVS